MGAHVIPTQMFPEHRKFLVSHIHSSEALFSLFSLFFSHPGCTCPKGFVGDRCEYAIDKNGAKSPDSFAKTSSNNGSMSGLGITAIVLSVCAILAVGLYTVNSCVRRKRFRRRRDGESSGLIWADKSGYKDSGETINFSPHKAGYSDDYMASFASPSRDPMATALAPDTSEANVLVDSDTSTGHVESDDEPQVFIGPPTVSIDGAL